eukprot:TRINITY_DN47738_c0_g1_i1.p1 TRINITY_DN47738_c0_g1~~TRINITY_DN47738_c0_g1_i1.p1  ORF type:complete len:326 (-),score=85.86 TRINITY_DN47738_c0_g1_i1:668-1645(-)
MLPLLLSRCASVLRQTPGFLVGVVVAWLAQWLHKPAPVLKHVADCTELHELASGLNAEIQAAATAARAAEENQKQAEVAVEAALRQAEEAVAQAKVGRAATAAAARAVEVANRHLAQAREGLVSGLASAPPPLDVTGLGEPAAGDGTDAVVNTALGQLGWGAPRKPAKSSALLSDVIQRLEPLKEPLLFIMDVGLVYFCLEQCSSQSVKSYLQKVGWHAVQALGIDALLLNGGAAKEGAVQPTIGANLYIRESQSASPTSPTVVAEQLKRVAGAVVMMATAVSILALVKVLTVFLDALELVFLRHLLVYAVLTIRICLVVLLVLF